MKRLLTEQAFLFDQNNSFNMWLIGPPIEAYKLLIHIDFDGKVKNGFNIKPVFSNALNPTIGLKSEYSIPESFSHWDLLIGNPENIAEELINVVQVRYPTEVKVSGKVSIYEINKEDRFTYVNALSN